MSNFIRKEDDKLKVGVYVIAPYSYFKDGKYRGIFITIWVNNC